MDDDGNPLKVAFHDFYDYMLTNNDENPLYLFDGFGCIKSYFY
jgi:hypothetical protein